MMIYSILLTLLHDVVELSTLQFLIQCFIALCRHACIKEFTQLGNATEFTHNLMLISIVIPFTMGKLCDACRPISILESPYVGHL